MTQPPARVRTTSSASLHSGNPPLSHECLMSIDLYRILSLAFMSTFVFQVALSTSLEAGPGPDKQVFEWRCQLGPTKLQAEAVHCFNEQQAEIRLGGCAQGSTYRLVLPNYPSDNRDSSYSQPGPGKSARYAASIAVGGDWMSTFIAPHAL